MCGRREASPACRGGARGDSQADQRGGDRDARGEGEHPAVDGDAGSRWH
jgi:hypothetical protein